MRQLLLGEGKVLCQRWTTTESIYLKRNKIVKQLHQESTNYFQTEKNLLRELKTQWIRGLLSMKEGGSEDGGMTELQDYSVEEVLTSTLILLCTCIKGPYEDM